MAHYFFAPPQYHSKAFDRQNSDLTLAALNEASIATARCVVDVGCGAGQTLRVVEKMNLHGILVGVDPDQGALLSGQPSSTRVHFLKAEGEKLPLADGAVSHAISRVAINYMHQGRALRELCRVLAPGGWLVMSYHGFGYNLKEAMPLVAGGFRQWLGNVKDLIAGLALQVFGVQGRRGTFWGRSVPYLSSWRLRRWLPLLNCEIVDQKPEGKFLGFVSTWWVVIEKKVS